MADLLAAATEPSTNDEPTRNFAWSNMFVHPDDDPGSDGGFEDERTSSSSTSATSASRCS